MLAVSDERLDMAEALAAEFVASGKSEQLALVDAARAIAAQCRLMPGPILVGLLRRTTTERVQAIGQIPQD